VATCTPATGACCLPDHSCAVLTALACAMQQGVYRGNNVPCSATVCNAFVAASVYGDLIPGDWNQDHVVNILDLSEFMNSYAAGLADMNGDGICDARDVARFLNMFYGVGAK
jgi:hypothetical protein